MSARAQATRLETTRSTLASGRQQQRGDDAATNQLTIALALALAATSTAIATATAKPATSALVLPGLGQQIQLSFASRNDKNDDDAALGASRVRLFDSLTSSRRVSTSTNTLQSRFKQT